MQLQIIPFRARHVQLINPNATAEDMRRALAAEKYADAYTACLLGDPVGCAGLSMHDENVAELWADFSPILKTMPVALWRACREKMAEVIEKRKPAEIWARIDPEDEQAQRFIEHLGFKLGAYLYRKEF